MLKKILIFLFLLFPFSFVSASTLFFSSPKNEYAPGENFFLDLKIDNVSECVNTIKSQVLFPKDSVEFINFLDGESFLTLWLKKPDLKLSQSINENGILDFAGGVPGGYCGRVPGDLGDSNAIARMVFKVKNSADPENTVTISLSSSTRVLLNDGFGSSDKIKINDFKFKIKESSSSPDYEWSKVVKTDKIPPEPFVVALHQNSRMFDGKYYIIFSTVDKQTGIDHYEVLELKKGEQVGVSPKKSFWERILNKNKPVPHWEIASMPYVLKDQGLQSIIKVRAIDKAGNTREVEYIPDKSYLLKNKHNKSFVYILLAIGFSALIILLIALFYNYKK